MRLHAHAREAFAVGVPQQSAASPIAESAKTFPYPDLPLVARHTAVRTHAVSQLIEYVAKAAAEHPYKVAFVAGERTIYFGQLPFLAVAAANRLNRADPGSGPIAILVPDSIDWIIAHLGARQLGRTTVSASININADDLPQCLEAMGVTAVLTSSGIELFSPMKTQDFGTDALVHIIANGCNQIETARLSENDIFSLSRDLIEKGNNSKWADIFLPTAISDLYTPIGQSKTYVTQNWIAEHVSKHWTVALHDPAIKILIQ